MTNYLISDGNADYNVTLPESDLQSYLATLGDGFCVVSRTAASNPDPAARLAADKAFGQGLIDSFVAASRDNGFDLAQTRAINALLSEVETYLQRGSISIAREALEEIEPTPLFPAQAKAYYLSIIDTYLSS